MEKNKKLNSKGFVMAETLIVTVFLMTIFAMIYSNYFPIMAEYQKREVYDDIDGKYSVYWIKKLIEDPSYNLDAITSNYSYYGYYDYNNRGYVRFRCSDLDTEVRETCIELVKSLEVDNCDDSGDECNIFITKYRIKDDSGVWFKDSVKINNYKRYMENCSYNNNSLSSCSRNTYINNCRTKMSATECNNRADKKVFNYEFKEFVLTLPDYKTASLNEAQYRVIVGFHHKKDNNNYYSYSTMEVSK